MTEQSYRKKLIEVALPLDAINVESAREKSIRHGHPSTLHLWWARRPLAACRAVLFAQLVDDPSSRPEDFPTEEEQDAERHRLFDIIEELVKWENTTNEEVLEVARAEIRKCFDGDPPPVLDPFAGGGSIPLEAQRLGLEAHASDLNPVAVLINKALIEIPPKFADQPPVHPEAENRTRWKGAEGLAEDVRRYGQWMRDEAERRIGHLYPKATLEDGTEANVIAWIWARTVTCPNPACGSTMPLASSFWLGKKKGKEAWIRPVVEGKEVKFEIGRDPAGPTEPPKQGRGAKFKCLVCREDADPAYTHSEIDAGRSAAVLMAVAAEGNRGREYRPPTQSHIMAADVERPESVPNAGARGTFGGNAQGQRYGFRTFADYFTNRQLVALTTLSDLVGEARARVEAGAREAGLDTDEACAYADSIATYLALLTSRTADQNNSLARWSSSRDQSIGLFARHAIPMVWDFPEVNPFAGAAGDLAVSIRSGIRVLDNLPINGRAGVVEQRDARVMAGKFIVATDPPYYDNIGYADLSDFFYVWLREFLKDVASLELFETIVTPKTAELIATPYRHGGSSALADEYFEDGFVDVFEAARESSVTDVPLTLFYAFKQEESTEAGIASTGWSTMLEGLHQSGWSVTATWPVRTERAARSVSIGTNALASSVVLACRPRSEMANVTDRQGLIRALRSELPGPIGELQKAAIAPVDMRQAAIGPGMAVYSQFSRVVEPNGEAMRVRSALVLINEVLESVLGEAEADFDSETRWAIQWFSQFFGDEGPYGVAESLAVSMNVAVGGIVESGILEAGGGRVRLLGRDELPLDWDPDSDDRIPVWEATQHLIRRIQSDGELAASALLRKLERMGLGESCKALAYRLFDICESARPDLAGPYNMLAASWPEIHRLAQQPYEPIVEPQQGLLLEED